MTENRKPFGLTLATKVAADAIRQSVAPLSTILYNLLALQKDTLFPKELDVTFFAIQRGNPNEADKKTVVKTLDILRTPHLNTAELLEKVIKDGWVIKKAPPVIKNNTPVYSKMGSKPMSKQKNKPKNKTSVKKEVVAPVVTVKKKFTI